MYTLEKYYYNIIQIHGFSLRILVNIDYTLSKVQQWQKQRTALSFCHIFRHASFDIGQDLMLMSDTFWELKYNRGITFIQCKCCTVKFLHHSCRAGPTLVWWHYIYIHPLNWDYLVSCITPVKAALSEDLPERIWAARSGSKPVLSMKLRSAFCFSISLPSHNHLSDSKYISVNT